MKNGYDIILFTEYANEHISCKLLGPYQLSSFLRSKGFSVLVVDHVSRYSKAEMYMIAKLACGDNTLFVGISNTMSLPKDEISFTHCGLEFDKIFVEAFKAVNPNVKIVVGGAHARSNTSNPFLDYSVLGYAEMSAWRLAKHLRDPLEPLGPHFVNEHGVKILTDRKADGYDFTQTVNMWCDDDIMMPGEVLPIESARGCIFKCKFCAYPMNGKKKLDYLRDQKQVKYELERNYELYGITDYFIVDDTFNESDEKLRMFAEVSASLPFELNFRCYLRLDLLANNYDQVKLLADAGLRGTFFGIETLSNAAGKIIGKSTNSEKLIETLQRIRSDYGDTIMTSSGFIIGLPEETLDECWNSYQRIVSGEVPLHNIGFQPLRITRPDSFAWNSEFGVNFKSYGYEEMQLSDVTSEEDKKMFSSMFLEHVPWKNNLTNVFEANKLSEKIMADFATHENLVPSSNQVFFARNYNISELLTNKTIKNYDFLDLKDKNVKQYKLKLMKYLTVKSKELNVR